ncbi:YhbY family RNA-binding protein [Elongatibacter sediminis]|uniref:YhbY family RNA-binding protein n=1 Tax=Elongatibacter sediminis TaxID=3119006 RepID=A0AAW9RDD7_9GAMM
MPLTNPQIRYLRGLSHPLQPVVTVAAKGLTENVMAELDSALRHHELIKVRLRAAREQRQKWIGEIEQACGAEIVHTIGQVACYFRRNPKKPVIALPEGGGRSA